LYKESVYEERKFDRRLFDVIKKKANAKPTRTHHISLLLEMLRKFQKKKIFLVDEMG
jgi:hypothetical protein